MKTLYYNCFAGISGDMNLAALINLGVDESALIAELKKLSLDGWEIKTSIASQNGISGTRLDVVCHHHHSEDCDGSHHHEHKHHHHEHRSFADIKKIISDSKLSDYVKEKSLAIFETIAKAEATVHEKNLDEVHFHEVGALDSIVDIVGAAICTELLNVENFVSTSVELGGGTVRCQHGILPVPAPATAIIAKKFPSKIGGENHECTTPTGAAIIATLCDSYNEALNGKILATGIGVGHREGKILPNILRVMLVDTKEKSSEKFESIYELSANIDDMTSEHIGFLCEKLFESSALDVWQESIVMKKNRLSIKVCALTKEDNVEKLRAVFFENSTTLGIRQKKIERYSLPRKLESFESSYGKVQFKISEFNGVKRAKPEFEDCKKIAEKNKISIEVITKKLINEFENR